MRICRTCGKEYLSQEKFCSIDGTALQEEVEAHLDQPKDPLIGTIVSNRYRVVERLGEGGMSVVYRAVQEALGRDVAIKILKEKLAKRVGSVERFIVEARASSKIDHPNIVSVFDFGQAPDGQYYMVMEYVDGVQLIKLIKEAGVFDQQRTINILRQLLMAVGAAHAAAVVHRDLKPENVLCERKGGAADLIKILDFGLAKFLGDEFKGGKLTRHGVILGTPFYMSPEQARGEPVDSRADLYSAGVMAYEMLTGTVPFIGSSAAVVLDHHLRTPPVPITERRPDLEIHPDMELFVLTLLSKLPALRYQTAEMTIAALDKIERKLLATPLSKAEVIRRTRPLFGIQTPSTSAGPAPMARAPRRVGRRTPTTIWDAPGLLDDSSRMARLWDERITDVADLLWGENSWADWAQETISRVRSMEETIKKQEAEITLLRQEISATEAKVRELEATIRFKRLDLVARQCVLREALADSRQSSDKDLFSKATLELDVDAEPVTYAGQQRDSKKLSHQLDWQIDELDRKERSVTKRQKETVEEYERTIRTKLRQVWGIRQRQIPLCADLVSKINAIASQREDLKEAVNSLAEVSGALQVYQALLRAVRQSSSTSGEH